MTSTDPPHEPGLSTEAEPDVAPRKRGLRARPLLAGLLVGLVGALIVAAVVLFVAGIERTPKLTRADFEAAVKRWETAGPSSYDLDVDVSGQRPGIVHVEVRDGDVTRMTRDGIQPMQRRTWYYWSVPGQFDMIEEELGMVERPAVSFGRSGAGQVALWAEFDPKYGYPLRFDRVALGADNEVHWKVTRFRPVEPEK